jgi:hypothetical protein
MRKEIDDDDHQKKSRPMDRQAGAHGPGPPGRDPHPPRHVKVRVTLPGRADRLEESLQALSTWTTDDLKRKIEGLAALRLGYQAVALLSHRGGRPLPNGALLTSLSLVDEAVDCALVTVPLVFRCEPPHGPVAGGTLVRIRGSGFLAVGGGARVSFGDCSVPCWRVADDELQCLAPPHTEGIVSVKLKQCCEAVRESTGGAASYEFASEGRLCDLIFATTNAHCPLRTSDRGAGLEKEAGLRRRSDH